MNFSLDLRSKHLQGHDIATGILELKKKAGSMEDAEDETCGFLSNLLLYGCI